MVSVFVSLMMFLSPMNNGHHNGWAKKTPRPTPAFQPVAPPPAPNHGTSPPMGSGSPKNPDGPGARQYTD